MASYESEHTLYSMRVPHSPRFIHSTRISFRFPYISQSRPFFLYNLVPQILHGCSMHGRRTSNTAASRTYNELAAVLTCQGDRQTNANLLV